MRCTFTGLAAAAAARQNVASKAAQDMTPKRSGHLFVFATFPRVMSSIAATPPRPPKQAPKPAVKRAESKCPERASCRGACGHAILVVVDPWHDMCGDAPPCQSRSRPARSPWSVRATSLPPLVWILTVTPCAGCWRPPLSPTGRCQLRQGGMREMSCPRWGSGGRGCSPPVFL